MANLSLSEIPLLEDGEDNLLNQIFEPLIVLTERFFTVMAYASKAHKDQVRKSINNAYKSYPFGVVEVVRGCSNSLVSDNAVKAPWRERKDEHIAKLRLASAEVLLVTAANKAHNVRAISTILQAFGEVIWERFNAIKDEIVWYNKSVYNILEDAGMTPILVMPIRSVISIMESH